MTDLQPKTQLVFIVAEAEEWRPIPGREGEYEASSWGRIRSLDRIDKRGHRRTGRILRPAQSREGYLTVDLDGSRTIHRLVLSAFEQAPTPQHQVNHIDGDKTNNRLTNLEWTTPAENVRHARDVLGRLHPPTGEKHHRAVLTQAQVDAARRRYTGERGQLAQLARELGASYHPLWKALHGYSWKEATE